MFYNADFESAYNAGKITGDIISTLVATFEIIQGISEIGEKKKETFDIYEYNYNIKGNLTKIYVNDNGKNITDEVKNYLYDIAGVN